MRPFCQENGIHHVDVALDAVLRRVVVVAEGECRAEDESLREAGAYAGGTALRGRGDRVVAAPVVIANVKIVDQIGGESGGEAERRLV